MPESFIIILPLPGGLLSPNYTVGSIGGRFARAAATKKYRRLAREAVEAEHIESGLWDKVSITAKFFHSYKRRRDPDNATGSLKAAYDGIVDAGLVVDDDYEHMEREKPILTVDPVNPRVELTITKKECH